MLCVKSRKTGFTESINKTKSFFLYLSVSGIFISLFAQINISGKASPVRRKGNDTGSYFLLPAVKVA
jgi:hypothetical protein